MEGQSFEKYEAPASKPETGPEIDIESVLERGEIEEREDEPGRVEINGDENHPVLKSIEGEGIFDYKNARPGKLYPYDGMNFLENLKYYFRSGYLLATDVQRQTVDN